MQCIVHRRLQINMKVWKQLTKVLCAATEETFSSPAKIQGDDKSQDETFDENDKFDELFLPVL